MFFWSNLCIFFKLLDGPIPLSYFWFYLEVLREDREVTILICSMTYRDTMLSTSRRVNYPHICSLCDAIATSSSNISSLLHDLWQTLLILTVVISSPKKRVFQYPPTIFLFRHPRSCIKNVTISTDPSIFVWEYPFYWSELAQVSTSTLLVKYVMTPISHGQKEV